MPLTRSFRQSIADRVRQSPTFVAALVEEAMQAFAAGDTETARTLLRDVADAARRPDTPRLTPSRRTAPRKVGRKKGSTVARSRHRTPLASITTMAGEKQDKRWANRSSACLSRTIYRPATCSEPRSWAGCAHAG